MELVTPDAELVEDHGAKVLQAQRCGACPRVQRVDLVVVIIPWMHHLLRQRPQVLR